MIKIKINKLKVRSQTRKIMLTLVKRNKIMVKTVMIAMIEVIIICRVHIIHQHTSIKERETETIDKMVDTSKLTTGVVGQMIKNIEVKIVLYSNSQDNFKDPRFRLTELLNISKIRKDHTMILMEVYLTIKLVQMVEK